MNRMGRLPVAVIVVLTVGITAANAEREEEIPLAKVPQEVLKAAQNAVPGITLTGAEVEKTRKGVVYEVKGTLGGKKYEIEVSAEGKVLEVEQEGDDDKDDDGDDGDDDDGDDKD
jgi:Mrp family chromosome partitioning ATPase